MKKRTAIITISILSVVAIGASIFSFLMYRETERNRTYISANFQHAFSELVNSASDMDNALKKSTVVTTPSMAGAVCAEVYGKAQTAQMALGVLPFSAYELERTAGFISTVGDYAFSLSQKAANGESFSPDERESLKQLSDTSAMLTMNLKEIQNRIGSGTVSFAEYRHNIKQYDDSEGEFLPEPVAETVEAAEEEFPEMPSLIYDGPFSEHLKGIEPRMLKDQEEIDVSQGREIVAQFLGIRPMQIFLSGEQEGDIPSIRYGANIGDDTVSVTVSRKGGFVYDMLSPRMVEESKISPEEAQQLAEDFLVSHGYENMTRSYFMIADNVMTANFAYVQDGVTCYSDLVKVGISMDDGTLHSFESKGFITAHYTREIPQPAISEEDAAERVPDDVSVLGTKLALIPNAGMREVICYEFECENESQERYIIYVNAVTGQQEKILIVLTDESGTLTI